MITGGRESWGRWLRVDERGLLIVLYASVVVAAVCMYLFQPVTAILLMLPLLVGALTLSPRHIPMFVIVVVVALLAQTLLTFGLTGIPARRFISAVVALAMSAVVLLSNRRRSGLGVSGYASDALLTELHVRLRRQAVMPSLPTGWQAESHLRAAGGTQFAGDFLLTHLEPGKHLRLLVVDVSGKGVAAGPKSLLLSGAFGSLLASTEPAEFLPEANHYVWRQDWPEGFATAVQLTLDLTTGDFVLRSAGHPPAVQLHAGSGRWTVHEGYEGAVLGLLEDESYDAVLGRMMPGDVLLLFTDGMVEAPGRDMTVGLDRLLGEVERTVHRRKEGFARDLVERLGARGDDCALVVVTRSANVAAGPDAAELERRLVDASRGTRSG
jgi:hypothetical protein